MVGLWGMTNSIRPYPGVFMAPAQQDGFDNTRNERTLEGGGSGAA